MYIRESNSPKAKIREVSLCGRRLSNEYDLIFGRSYVRRSGRTAASISFAVLVLDRELEDKYKLLNECIQAARSNDVREDREKT